MTLAGIELRYLVNQISEATQDYYVSNIYGVTKDSILFKLHHTEKSDQFMMLSTSGVWLTSVKIDQMEPNRLLKRLRSDLLRLKIKKIEHLDKLDKTYGKGTVMKMGDAEIVEIDSEYKHVNWWKEKVSPKHELDLLVGDRNSDMGAGWAVGARLFKVPESIGIDSVFKRIVDEKDQGDEFSPLR